MGEKFIFKDRRYSIQNRRRAYLNWVANHYNSNNRSVVTKHTPTFGDKMLKGETCSYTPAHAGTIGCPIGAMLPIDLAKKLPNSKSVSTNYIWVCLPLWMRGLGMGFCQQLQNLHDIKRYWNETGLSEEGIKAVGRINTTYSLILCFLICFLLNITSGISQTISSFPKLKWGQTPTEVAAAHPYLKNTFTQSWSEDSTKLVWTYLPEYYGEMAGFTFILFFEENYLTAFEERFPRRILQEVIDIMKVDKESTFIDQDTWLVFKPKELKFLWIEKPKR